MNRASKGCIEPLASLRPFFAPKAAAVIGASETYGSVGRTVLQNLMATSFGGTVTAVNPKHDHILGLRAYPHVGDVPEALDLAVIATPASTVPGIIRECVEAKIPSAIVLSAGFKECGAQGAELERRMLVEAQRGDLRIIGPNCLGVMSPRTGLNATFARTMAYAGSVAFLSQSGALCSAVLDWSLREEVGFSAFCSLGSMLDIGWGELIAYLGEDPDTHSILIYMESVGDACSFLQAAQRVAPHKPIIVLKAGRTAAGAKAAASHTGALTGSDAVLDAAFRRCGVLRVDTIAELFHMAEILACQPRPRGPRLTILTNAGGAGVLAADALVAGGGKLAQLHPDTVEMLNQTLPPAWSHGNPIDILGDATPERFAAALAIAANAPDTDGLLVVLTPQAMTDPTRIAESVLGYARQRDKPLLASWMGGEEVAAGQSILRHGGVPVYAYPDTAARLFHSLWRYEEILANLAQTPVMHAPDAGEVDPARVARILEKARCAGRTLLTEPEAKQVLTASGIPTVATRIATSVEAAVQAAEEIGYPVVLKLYSETITHKTDVGGVKLDLANAAAVLTAYREIATSVHAKAGPDGFQGVTVQPMIRQEGYELILGSSVDPQFGPVLLFGMGGQLVEVFEDRTLDLPPLTETLARRMMARTHIFKALQGVRGRPPVDLAGLDRLLVRFSELAATQRWIREIDINPLLASPQGLLALDARIVLHDPSTSEETFCPPALTAVASPVIHRQGGIESAFSRM